MYINDREGNPLILASASPRRRRLIDQFGIAFEVIAPDVPENPVQGADPAEEAKRIAEDKATWVLKSNPGDRWILAADTMVIIDGDILGKPRDEKEAMEMLGRLAGRWHSVITGWCILNGRRKIKKSGSVESRVFIKSMSPEHIRTYVRGGEPMDKAGAYAAQGQGAFMIRTIEGSYSNVVGLPLAEVVEALEELGAIKLSRG